MEAKNADNEKQLCRFIAEKHERFLLQYRQEVASLERIFVLQEEIDQFTHWISAGKLNYSERKSQAVAELNSLSRNTSKKINAKRIDALKLKIKEHEAALSYWKGRYSS